MVGMYDAEMYPADTFRSITGLIETDTYPYLRCIWTGYKEVRVDLS